MLNAGVHRVRLVLAAAPLSAGMEKQVPRVREFVRRANKFPAFGMKTKKSCTELLKPCPDTKAREARVAAVNLRPDR